MARTPEQKRQIAREFQKQFQGKPGKKTLQLASADSGLEGPPPRPPRGPGLPHRLSDENWLRGVKRSKNAQAEIAQIIHESTAAWEQRQEVSARLRGPRRLSTIVGDANVILYGIGHPGLSTCRDIVDLVRSEKVGLIVTNPITLELNNVARLPNSEVHLDDKQLRDLDHLLSQFAINVSCLIDGDPPERVLADPSDTKYITALLVSRAEYLVSRDGDLLDFEPLGRGNLSIITPQAFLNIIRRRF